MRPKESGPSLPPSAICTSRIVPLHRFPRNRAEIYSDPEALPMTHSCVWHDSFICVAWLIHMCDMTRYSRHTHEWMMCVYRTMLRVHGMMLRVYRIIVRSHLHVWHDSFICVTWLIHMCDMTHSYVWHDSFIRVTWLIHMCDMTRSYVWYDSFIRVTSHHSFMCVAWLGLA